MQEALTGLLEDQGLQDDAELHLSLAPGLQGGETGLLAQCDKSELQALLMSLAQAGVDVQAVVPLFPPSGQGVQVHAQHDPEEADAETPSVDRPDAVGRHCPAGFGRCVDLDPPPGRRAGGFARGRSAHRS